MSRHPRIVRRPDRPGTNQHSPVHSCAHTFKYPNAKVVFHHREPVAVPTAGIMTSGADTSRPLPAATADRPCDLYTPHPRPTPEIACFSHSRGDRITYQ